MKLASYIIGQARGSAAICGEYASATLGVLNNYKDIKIYCLIGKDWLVDKLSNFIPIEYSGYTLVKYEKTKKGGFIAIAELIHPEDVPVLIYFIESPSIRVLLPKNYITWKEQITSKFTVANGTLDNGEPPNFSDIVGRFYEEVIKTMDTDAERCGIFPSFKTDQKVCKLYPVDLRLTFIHPRFEIKRKRKICEWFNEDEYNIPFLSIFERLKIPDLCNASSTTLHEREGTAKRTIKCKLQGKKIPIGLCVPSLILYKFGYKRAEILKEPITLGVMALGTSNQNMDEKTYVMGALKKRWSCTRRRSGQINRYPQYVKCYEPVGLVYESQIFDRFSHNLIDGYIISNNDDQYLFSPYVCLGLLTRNIKILPVLYTHLLFPRGNVFVIQKSDVIWCVLGNCKVAPPNTIVNCMNDL